MPETAVDKDGELDAWKHNVSLSSQAHQGSSVNEIA